MSVDALEIRRRAGPKIELPKFEIDVRFAGPWAPCVEYTNNTAAARQASVRLCLRWCNLNIIEIGAARG